MIDYTKISRINKNSVHNLDIYMGHYLIAKDFQQNPILGVGPKNYTQHCNNNKKYQTLSIYAQLILTILIYNYFLKPDWLEL